MIKPYIFITVKNVKIAFKNIYVWRDGVSNVYDALRSFSLMMSSSIYLNIFSSVEISINFRIFHLISLIYKCRWVGEGKVSSIHKLTHLCSNLGGFKYLFNFSPHRKLFHATSANTKFMLYLIVRFTFGLKLDISKWVFLSK